MITLDEELHCSTKHLSKPIGLGILTTKLENTYIAGSTTKTNPLEISSLTLGCFSWPGAVHWPFFIGAGAINDFV